MLISRLVNQGTSTPACTVIPPTAFASFPIEVRFTPDSIQTEPSRWCRKGSDLFIWPTRLDSSVWVVIAKERQITSNLACCRGFCVHVLEVNEDHQSVVDAWGWVDLHGNSR
jgi:hypothetical protein